MGREPRDLDWILPAYAPANSELAHGTPPAGTHGTPSRGPGGVTEYKRIQTSTCWRESFITLAGVLVEQTARRCCFLESETPRQGYLLWQTRSALSNELS